jgi:hypothetical protein
MGWSLRSGCEEVDTRKRFPGLKDLTRWNAFPNDILGVEVADGGKPGRSYLRMDYWHHRIVLEENGADDLMTLGLSATAGATRRADCGALCEPGRWRCMFRIEHAAALVGFDAKRVSRSRASSKQVAAVRLWFLEPAGAISTRAR